MKFIRTASAAVTFLFLTAAAYAGAVPKVGEEYEIRKSYETSEIRSDGGSGSSSGHAAILERVIEVRADGMELEYDLPNEATAEDRAREWMFPARIFRSPSGHMSLLNRPELEKRLESWLAKAKWDRRICGHWIFTWDAFRIDCDPQSVIAIIDSFDLRSADLRDGASFRVAESRGPGTLTRKSSGPNGSTFTAVMEIDPEAVRRAQAETDVALGEIMQKPVTMEAALGKRAKEGVSGTISVTFETDASGEPRSRTKVTKVQIESVGGQSETRTATETVERRRVRSTTESAP